MAKPEPDGAAPPGRQVAAWQAAVSSLLARDGSGTARSTDPARRPMVGVQLELHRPTRTQPHVRVSLRPVMRSEQGRWVRSGISWANVAYVYGYHQARPPEEHLTLLHELLSLGSDGGYLYASRVIYLDDFRSRRVWDVLAEAAEVGLPLVNAGRTGGGVTVHGPVAARAALLRRDGDLVLRPEVLVDGAQPLPAEALLVAGDVAAAAWETPETAGGAGTRLHLAPVSDDLAPELAELRTSSEIVVPADDEPDFFRRFYPQLVARLPVVAPGGDVALPRPHPARLLLHLDQLPEHVTLARWRWVVEFGGVLREAPLGPAGTGATGGVPDTWRDRETEAALEAAVAAVAEALPALVTGPAPGTASGPRLRPEARLDAEDTARLHTEVLPKLAVLDGVSVEIVGEVPHYRTPESEPQVHFESSQDRADTDWFDLAITVSVDGRTVPFGRLFVALVRGHHLLVLDDGTVVNLRTERFAQLLQLIHESQTLQDAEAGALRVSRYQQGIWHDVAELGDVSGPAQVWRDAVRAVLEARSGAGHEGGSAPSEPPAVPEGLEATLRPYQREGFAWLSALYRYRLGGILADDMGLGKTLQCLALICHAREQSGEARPFLVVAPTSVVGTWAAEAERFTPGLRVVAVTQTRAKRQADVADLVAGADVVITSYTLLRLEHPQYRGIDWAGLILDEAQFAKNHRTKAHETLRELSAPFKLAITGTPMENNLMELWSLFAITSPGLLGTASRFMEFYQKPIETTRNPQRLALLRRRVRPLMLRRTKEQVAHDLPEKQEQVLRLDLNDAHRRAYDLLLHRERQKVLKLLVDLDKNRFAILRSLTLLRQAALDVDLVATGDRKPVSSTKLDALMELVTDVAAEGHRVLVFSQFTRFLGAARARLDAAGIASSYLDGATRHRQDVIEEFRTGTAPAFLISLKAGGFGLTLTEADYCIMLDPWWNPAAESQAVDRAHRIGQTRPVMVYRLVARNTIEEKVLAMQEAKRELFRSVVDDGGFDSAALTADDVRALLY